MPDHIPLAVLAGFAGMDGIGRPNPPAALVLVSRGALRMRIDSALALALALAPLPATAHPHVYIDGGVDFLFDSEGRLARLRVTWVFDALSSLFIMEDLGIGAEATLTPEDRNRIAAY
jgi:hypothetical protein